MTVKLTVEAGTPEEALRFLSELIPVIEDKDIKEYPYAYQGAAIEAAQRTHNSVTDLAEALKASLPIDVEDIRDKLVEVEERLSRLEAKATDPDLDSSCGP